ncbi:Gfo/Idh/MocA family oxidoreductase [Virgisporangium ochraceum]|uniref:Oxidoreductase n=1 Tax=Virgisporangium ochraceum TaxID=65505 RepID=A0A8J3ZMT6_9ACTN|nr:Gfo/Idh/MocA family oxidoreductase [Virgisporangium ochraceum]GIJ67189.1 oxidoreductase [Virgisporangium ochraceum]
MTGPLRVGVVGLGWAGRTHAESFQAHPDAEVVAIAGKEGELAAEVAARLGIPNTYPDWADMIDAGGLDVVSIATPNALHLPIAVAAMKSGLHVLCEKPLAADAEQAAAMVACAEETDRVLETVFNHRNRGDMALLRRIVDEGRLGDIYYAKAAWMRRRNYEVRGWFANREAAGGGPLIDLGVHMLDMLLTVMGEPEVTRVTGSTYATLAPRWLEAQGRDPAAWQVEDLATGMLHTADGATLLLEASWAVHGPYADDDMSIHLHGARGGASVRVQDYVVGPVRVYHDVAGQPTESVVTPGASTGHLTVVRDFVEVVRGGDWDRHRGQAGLKRSRIISALYESAATGAEVRL